MFADVFSNALGDVQRYNFKVVLGDTVVLDNDIEAPSFIAEQEAFQIFSQIMQDQRPMKFIASTTSYIDIELDGSKRKPYKEEIEVHNVAWVRAHKEE